MTIHLRTSWVRVAWLTLALALTSCSGGIGATDVEQTRLDTPAPRIETTDAVVQTLVPRDAGLTAIELLLAVYPDPPPQGALTARLYDDQGVEVAHRDYPLADLKHNAPFRFEFAPQRDSAGRVYRLAFSGPPGNPATFWATKTDAYTAGQLFDQGQAQPGDLNFKTQTHLGYADLAALLVQGALSGLWLLLPLLGAYGIPVLRIREIDLAFKHRAQCRHVSTRCGVVGS